MDSGVQTNLHGFGRGKHNHGQRSSERGGAIIYNLDNKHNPERKKMPATIAIKILYVFGFMLGGFAFVANLQAWIENINSALHGAITITLGIAAIIFFYWRIREKKADTNSKELDNRMKKFDLEDAENAHHHKKKTTKR